MGANTFLALSLAEVFGPGTTSNLSGLVVNADNAKISAMQHRQTLFSQDGKQFILDPTPSSDIDFGTKPERLPTPRGSNEERRPALAPVFESGNSHLSPQTNQTYEVKSICADTELNALISGFKERMKVVFGQPNDQLLFKHMVGFDKHDPARKAIEVLLRHKNGFLDLAGIEEAISYFTSCKTADGATRRRLKIDYYSPGFLDQLISDMHQLRYIVQKSDFAAVPVVKSIEDY